MNQLFLRRAARHLLWVSVLLFFAFAMYRVLLTQQGIVARADMTFPWNTAQIYSFIGENSYPWDPNQLGGIPHVADPGGLVPSALVLLLIAQFLPTTVSGVTWLITWAFAAGAFAYFACFHLSGNRLSSFLSATFYMSSTYIGNAVLGGDQAAIMSYAIMPLAVFFSIRAMETGRRKNTILSGLSFGLILTFTLTQAALFLLALVIICVTFALSHNGGRPILRQVAAKFLTISAVGLGLNGFWILPYVFNSVSSQSLNWYVPPLDYSLKLYSGSTNAYYTLVGASAGEYRDIFFSYSTQVFYLVSLTAIALVALTSLISRPRDWRILAVGAIFAVVFVPANGTNPPTGQVFSWLYRNVSFLVLFDRPYFSSSMIELCLAFLLNFAVVAFIQTPKTHNISRPGTRLLRRTLTRFVNIIGKPKRVQLLLFFVIGLIIIQSSWPMLSGDLDGRISRFQFPAQYQDLQNWLAAQQGQFRVLMLPPYTAGQWAWFPQSGNNLQTRYNPFNNPLVQYPSDPTLTLGWGINYNKLSAFVINSIYLNRTVNAAKLLGLLGVQYVVVSLDQLDISSWSLNYAPYQNTALVFHNIIPHLIGLTLTWQESSIYVFKNDYFLPLFLSSDNYAFAAADYTILDLLASSKSFDIRSLPLVFSEQLDRSNLAGLAKNASFMIIQNQRWLDLVLGMTAGTVWINPSSSTNQSPKYQTQWTSSNLVYNFGSWDQPFYLEGPFRDPIPWSIAAGKDVTSSVGFTVPIGGFYDVWARTYDGLITGPYSYPYEQQSVSFSIDSKLMQTLTNSTPVMGDFTWKHIGNITIGAGTHSLSLRNNDGFDFVSQVALVPVGGMEAALSDLSKLLNSTLITQAYTFDWSKVSRDSLYDGIPVTSYMSNHGWVVSGGTQQPSEAITNWMTTFKQGDSISVPFSTGSTATHVLYMTGFSSMNKAILTYSVDNRSTTNIDWYANSTQDTWTTLTLGTYNLTEGQHILTITNEGRASPSSAAGKGSLEGTYPGDQAGLYVETQTGVPMYVPDNNSTSGMAVSSLTDNMTTHFNTFVTNAGAYTVDVRLRSAVQSTIQVSVDGFIRNSFNIFPSPSYTDYITQPIRLTEGSHDILIAVGSARGVVLDELTILSSSPGTSETLQDFLLKLAPARNISWQSTNPTQYEIVTAGHSTTEFVTFLGSFSPQWQAKTQVGVVDPVLAYGFANGYIVSQQQAQSIRLRFLPGSYQLPGLGISLTVLVLSTLYLAAPKLRILSRFRHSKSSRSAVVGSKDLTA